MSRKIKIATGKNRFESQWHNREVEWEDLAKKLMKTTVTSETLKEFKEMKKDDQDKIKDVGGFVGGTLKDGMRRNGFVECRSLITLDMDECEEGILDELAMNIANEAVVYSTHKHTSKKPRLRVILPLTRDVTAEEYEAIARKVAESFNLGMEVFDDTTFQAARLMFWPSTSKDAEFIGERYKGPWIDPDKELAKYNDWKDVTEWPASIREGEVERHAKTKLGDPTEKGGIIGAFCKAYTITQAIAKFLPDTYVQGRSEDRYTYTAGSTANGLIIYDDKIAYSNHSTDPIGGKAVNSFDLVRIHKFGELDYKLPSDTPVSQLESYKAMKELAEADEEVKKLYKAVAKADIRTALEDFQEEVTPGKPREKVDDSWMDELETGKNGTVRDSVENYEIIFKHDPNLKGLVGFNTFKGDLPYLLKKTPWVHNSGSEVWTDTDDAALRIYFAKVYGLQSWGLLKDALQIAMEENSFNPVKSYIESTKWDGTKRIEEIFIRYLGADDNTYVRTVTKKMMVAAVARIYRPGCKFDYMVTLIGKQGIGKSLLIYKLAHGWGSDSLPDVRSEKAYDALQGVWIMEIGELAALKKTDRESIKLFISKTEDTYRKAYAKNTTVNKRNCIFIGTTNDDSFLNDATGARRFLPIDTNESKVQTRVWEGLNDEEVAQLWAEAKSYYDAGEKIMDMPEEVAKAAAEQQELHGIDNPLLGTIEEFLEKMIPEGWEDKSLEDRARYFRASDEFNDETEKVSEIKKTKRYTITAVEIWCECMQKDRGDINYIESQRINECLAQLGWTKSEKQHRFGPYGKQRYYSRPLSDAEKEELPW